MLLDHRATALELSESRLVATFQLGEPPVGALQLRFSPGDEPDDLELAETARFAVRGGARDQGG